MFTCEEKLKMLLFFLWRFKLLLPKTIRDTNAPVSLSIDSENAIKATIMAKVCLE